MLSLKQAIEIRKEFQILMNIKESFSKNLTSPDPRRLVISHPQLEETRNLENTSELDSDLNLKFHELRELQKNQQRLEQIEEATKENAYSEFAGRYNEIE